MSNRSTATFHRDQESFLKGNLSSMMATALIGKVVRNVFTGKIVLLTDKVQVAPAQYKLIGNDGNLYQYIGKKIIPAN